MEIRAPKRIIDEYKLRQSILHFQLVRVDRNNIACPTDCFYQTESMHEIEGKFFIGNNRDLYICVFLLANGQQKIAKLHTENTVKLEKIDQRNMFSQGT